jgi:threonine/homoserine/homoserine lactone efflux protein
VIWAGAALFGLNALFHAVPVLFMSMKLLGALFLLWIAYQIFRHAREPLTLEGEAAQGNPFWRGFLVQIGNPKVMVFFGSIFIAMLPANPPLWMLLALLAIVSLNEVWWYSVVALFFGAEPVRRFYLMAKAWIDRVTGLFLGALGLRLLWGARDIA